MKRALLIIGVALMFISCQSTSNAENLKLPDRLLGVTLNYSYTGGNSYAVKFEKEGLSYQYRTGGSPEKWWGKFKYNHLLTEENEHFVSWFEPGYGDYVTLLINFDKKVLYGSAIIKGKIVHFEKATIKTYQSSSK